MFNFGFNRSVSLTVFSAFLFLSATFLLNWRLDLSKITSLSFLTNQKTSPRLNCFNEDLSSPSPSPSPSPWPSPSPSASPSLSESLTCPEYFRWIHEDLKPWKRTGITRDMVELGKSLADFRLVIHKGKAYVETYRRSFQTRDVFTLWGISQLLKMYPGKVPDLELLFHCGDLSKVNKRDYLGSHPRMPTLVPPPLFHYCGDDTTFDIVFPDWSFWGWGELNIRPWETLLKDIEEGNRKMKWKDRIPYAFWKGNPTTSPIRNKLLKCNASHQHDAYAHIYSLSWDKEIQQNFKNTKLENQCTHRYNIYAEGRTWSVSEKYILACDSMTMFIEPKNYDFYTRSLVPMQHYWPIRPKKICNDIKFAVEWGNSHHNQAQKIGREGTKFLQEQVKMKYVYDYMLHVLREYASLMKFKPVIPVGASEICSEVNDCHMEGAWKEFLNESKVESPSSEPPCELPSPYETRDLQQILGRKNGLIQQAGSKRRQTWLDVCFNS
ncbi:uncharacterized protein LOC129288627 [Prosopis cineraria]|uniref:uncharacterized protein LOC129288627 n=1 Tax=Prosopis cineraria TaxID=364024 RepID=UPI00240FDBF2|nr:uncharacterized protein LOC129288627 [Prosopis cineraria]